jgi:hypothetical protein
MREDDRLRMFVNRMLKRTNTHRERKYQDAKEKCIMRSFIIYTFYEIIFWLQNLKRTSQGRQRQEDNILWILRK